MTAPATKRPASRLRGMGDSANDHDHDSMAYDTAKEDARSYLIPGQDAKGHSERVWCRVMPGHHRALGMIYGSRQFPFRSMGDIMRWCIDQGIRELSRRGGSGPSIMRQVDVLMEILRDEVYQQDFTEMFQTLHGVVNRHTAAQALGEARRVVAVAKQHLEAMPEGYWRDKYLGELETQFGHLLTGDGVQLR